MAKGQNALAIGSALVNWGKAASPESIGLDLSGLRKKKDDDEDKPKDEPKDNDKDKEKTPEPKPEKQTELTMQQIAQGDKIHQRKPDESDTWPKGLDHTSFEEFKVAATSSDYSQHPFS